MEPARLMAALRVAAPGVAAAVAVALAARAVSRLLPETAGALLHEVVLAVALGIAIAAIGVPAAAGPGLRTASTRVLRIGIVLLGARIALDEVVALGATALAVVGVLMLVAFAVALTLGRALAVGSRTATLVGVGVAVCGNSAIAASAPTIGAGEEEVARAIAVNTLFGTLAMFAYPLIGAALSLEAASYGMWSGTAINDTAQVVAAGFAHSDAAGETAVTVKLVRNALMAPVLVALAVAFGRAGRDGLSPARLRRAVPGFVLAFLALAVASSLGAVDAASRAVGVPLADTALAASRVLILVGLAAVGLSTAPAALRRGGARVLLIGFAAAFTVALTSLAIITLVDPLG